jgi:hypothetical protein
LKSLHADKEEFARLLRLAEQIGRK